MLINKKNQENVWKTVFYKILLGLFLNTLSHLNLVYLIIIDLGGTKEMFRYAFRDLNPAEKKFVWNVSLRTFR